MNLTLRPPAGRRRLARGFTLLELLISISIGLIVMVALISVYLNISRTNTEMAKTNSMIESGRFTMDLLQEDVEHAGFWGGYVPRWDDFAATAMLPSPYDTLDSTGVVASNPCLATANWTGTVTFSMVSLPVMTFGTAPTGCSISNQKANTDVLVVRRAEVCSPGSGNCAALNTSAIYFQPTFCASEMSASTPTFYVGPSSTLTLHKRDCTTLADIRQWVQDIYYVRTYSTTVGDGIPTLVRLRFDGTQFVKEPLIEGVEGFVVDLGIDSKDRCNNGVNYGALPYRINPSTCAYDATTASNNTMPNNRGDGVPESYVHCPSSGCSVSQLRDVVAVKLFVLARTREAATGADDGKSYTLGSVSGSTVTITPPAGDKYRRHLFLQNIRLNNVSGRRESP
ncbi:MULTISPECIES: PilW family protein [Ramlibacter]|uniref:PilW family protein n=1 Tax=Ramlibacter aquaticus TaxID=2780094 RepID=A0ABR9SHX3_9BURK|nr:MULTISPECIES: PilW family protein [Ramlibacter]MBE7941971.1 PilW family protein [Ramlibacter aquaticus]